MKTNTLIPNEIIVAVDFDGTITTDGNQCNLSDMVLQPHCKKVLKKMVEDGDMKLVLWTCRTGTALEDAKNFLKAEGMLELFSAINEQVIEVYEKYKPLVARKVGADFYIDDKNVLSPKVDWTKIEEFFFGYTE